MLYGESHNNFALKFIIVIGESEKKKFRSFNLISINHTASGLYQYEGIAEITELAITVKLIDKEELHILLEKERRR